jgi:hypothetical protein
MIVPVSKVFSAISWNFWCWKKVFVMGEDKKPTLSDGFKSVKLSDWSVESLAQLPCARSALIAGFSSAIAVGLARFIGSST